MSTPIAASLSVAEVMEVVENLPASVMVVSGVVTGKGLQVELDNPAVFAALAARSEVVYCDVRSWGDNADVVARIPAGLDAEPAVATACTVLAGVVHVVTGADAGFVAEVQKMQRRLDQEDARWEAARNEAAARVGGVVEEIEAIYPDRLVADESWLVTVDHRGRYRIASDWAAADYPDVCTEQRVRTALLHAVGRATDRRDREVVTARLAAFEATLDTHAQRLAGAPGWALATTKATREAHARRYIGEVDPLVPPAVVLDRLIAQARVSLANL